MYLLGNARALLSTIRKQSSRSLATTTCRRRSAARIMGFRRSSSGQRWYSSPRWSLRVADPAAAVTNSSTRPTAGSSGAPVPRTSEKFRRAT